VVTRTVWMTEYAKEKRRKIGRYIAPAENALRNDKHWIK